MRAAISTSSSLLLVLALAMASAASAAVAPGALDPSFGDGGRRTVAVSLAPGVVPAKSTASALDSDRRVHLAGAAAEGNGIVLSRLTPDGQIDLDFGESGSLHHTPAGLTNTQVHDAAFDATGRLVVVGSAQFTNYTGMMVCRFGADGAPELEFGDLGNGCVVLVTGDGGNAEAVLMQHCPVPDECPAGDRILVAGSALSDGQDLGIVVALQADGKTLDDTFGTSGIASVPVETSGGGLPTRFSSIAQDADGNLAVAGALAYLPPDEEDKDMLVARLDPAGVADAGFSSDGYVLSPFDLGSNLETGDYVDDQATAVRLLDDGSILIAGFARADTDVYRPAVMKLLPDGSGDPTFDGGIVDDPGKVSYALCNADCSARAYDLDVLPDGRIIVAGEFTNFADVQPGDPLGFGRNFFALRLLSDGTQDAGFGSADSGAPGLALVDFGGVGSDSDDLATDLLVDGDRLLLAGRARAADPLPDDESLDNFDFAVARLGNGVPIFADGFED